jgi:hypothetical protein
VAVHVEISLGKELPIGADVIAMVMGVQNGHQIHPLTFCRLQNGTSLGRIDDRGLSGLSADEKVGIIIFQNGNLDDSHLLGHQVKGIPKGAKVQDSPTAKGDVDGD